MTLYKWTNINEYVVYELCAGHVDTRVDDTVYINLHQYTNAYVDDKPHESLTLYRLTYCIEYVDYELCASRIATGVDGADIIVVHGHLFRQG